MTGPCPWLGEKDVINDLSRVVAVNRSASQPSLSVSLEEGLEKAQRFFLENVRSELSEGEFYMDHNASQLYVWPRPAWLHGDGARPGGGGLGGPRAARLKVMAPVAYSIISMNHSDHVILSNITFVDSSYDTAGCWSSPGLVLYQ
jgi:hypothetical protein